MTDLIQRIVLALILGVVPAEGAVSEEPAVAVQGYATWYDAPSRADAAAGPALRELLGSDWRGEWVKVTYRGRSVTVQLTDFCACGPRNGRDTVIDLDDAAFRSLAPLGRGVIVVTVEPVDAPALPATDTAP